MNLRTYAVRALRSKASRGFASGLVCGAILCGLLSAGAYFALGWFRWPLVFFAPLAARPATTMPDIAGYSPPELRLALAAYLSGATTLIVGSSELDGAAPAFEPLSERVAACAGQRSFIMPRPRGGALYRAALLTESLSGAFGTETPVRLIVIDNSHYATVGAGDWPDPRSVLGSAEQLRYHLLRNPRSFLSDPRDSAPGAGFAFAEARLLEWRAFRRMLGRRILLPIRRSLHKKTQTPGSTSSAPNAGPIPERPPRSESPEARDADWQVATRFVPPLQTHVELRRRKAQQADLAVAAYGRSAAAFAETARELLPAGSKIQVLALPLHRRFYERLDFPENDLRNMQARRLEVLQESFANTPVRLRIAGELAPGRFFYDSIHYNASGRERLARSICKALHQPHSAGESR